MSYNKLALFTFPLLFTGFYFLPAVVNVGLFFLLLTALFFFQTQSTSKRGECRQFFKDYHFLFILLVSYLILPFYVFWFNAMIFFLVQFFKFIENRYSVSIGQVFHYRITFGHLFFLIGSCFLLSSALFLFPVRLPLASKVVFLMIIPLFYTIIYFYPWQRSALKGASVYIFVFFGQFLMIILQNSDLHIHWYNSAILAGFPVVFLLSVLMYLLDMVYKKELVILFLIQYFLFIFLGSRAFSIFFISFVFFYLQRRTAAELSYSLTSGHYKKVLKEKNNFIVYFVPLLLSFLSIFLRKKYYYPYFYVMLLSGFSFFILFYMQESSSAVLRLLRSSFFSLPAAEKFLFPNAVLLFYLGVVYFLTKLSFLSLFLSFICSNLFYSLYLMYKTYKHKKNFIYKDVDLIFLGYLSSVSAGLLFYFFK